MSTVFRPIDDGYTRDGETAPTEFKYPVVKFKYRPAIGKDASRHRHNCNAGADAEEKSVITLLMAHVKGWELTDDKGNGVPVTAENLTNMYPLIRSQIVDIVMGYTPQQQDADAKN